MKKFIVTALTLMSATATAAVLCCGCTDGNADTDIEYTAIEPVLKYGDLLTKNRYASFGNYKKEDGYDIYEDFGQYYRNEIGDKVNGDFYLLNPHDGLTGWIPHHLYRTIDLYADNLADSLYENPVISQELYLYDKTIGEFSGEIDDISDGASYFTVSLTLILNPTDEEISGNDFTLEYGNNAQYYTNKYINIYRDNICIATCYYEERDFPIKRQWFESFFENNLSKENLK